MEWWIYRTWSVGSGWGGKQRLTMSFRLLRCRVSEALGLLIRLDGAEKVKEAPGSPVLVRDRQG